MVWVWTVPGLSTSTPGDLGVGGAADQQPEHLDLAGSQAVRIAGSAGADLGQLRGLGTAAGQTVSLGQQRRGVRLDNRHAQCGGLIASTFGQRTGTRAGAG